MSETKTRRRRKRQLGQFYTPTTLAQKCVARLKLTKESRVLEPSSGDGAFVLPLIERFMALHSGTRATRLRKTLCENVIAVELDRSAYKSMIRAIEKAWGPLPKKHNLVCGDFFTVDFDGTFDLIIGNPPFGGTINPKIQDKMDGRYGVRDGFKIKKETYSFFIVRCVEMLAKSGRLKFICSDTFLTIPTMKGLREFLLNRGRPRVTTLGKDFEETSQPMVWLEFERRGHSREVLIDGTALSRDTIDLTGNRSWQITESLSRFFQGPKLGDMMVASSGMTIGRNEWFVREVVDGRIEEPFNFEFAQEPITLKRELERARLGRISDARQAKIIQQERRGETRRTVRVVPKGKPRTIPLPHADYCYYNKATSDIIYSAPTHAVYWRDDGDAVITFKKSGNWYLHGVGGQPYFKREGLTWQLIAPSLNARYLPAGFILDSGAPCAFLRPGVDRNELWFILGWCLTPLCTQLLKDVLNHTRNIQSKDFERLPYPFWVSPKRKRAAMTRCRKLVESAQRTGRSFQRTDKDVVALIQCYDAH